MLSFDSLRLCGRRSIAYCIAARRKLFVASCSLQVVLTVAGQIELVGGGAKAGISTVGDILLLVAGLMELPKVNLLGPVLAEQILPLDGQIAKICSSTRGELCRYVSRVIEGQLSVAKPVC